MRPSWCGRGSPASGGTVPEIIKTMRYVIVDNGAVTDGDNDDVKERTIIPMKEHNNDGDDDDNCASSNSNNSGNQIIIITVTWQE